MRYPIQSTLAAAALVLAVAGQSAPAMAADGSFDIVNSNGSHSIQQVWSAEAGNRTDPWYSIPLTSPVASGTTRSFTTHGAVCFYDIKVQFNDGVVQQFDNVNVCRGQKVVGA